MEYQRETCSRGFLCSLGQVPTQSNLDDWKLLINGYDHEVSKYDLTL